MAPPFHRSTPKLTRLDSHNHNENHKPNHSRDKKRVAHRSAAAATRDAIRVRHDGLWGACAGGLTVNGQTHPEIYATDPISRHATHHAYTKN